jgi:hypothetical protein
VEELALSIDVPDLVMVLPHNALNVRTQAQKPGVKRIQNSTENVKGHGLGQILTRGTHREKPILTLRGS